MEENRESSSGRSRYAMGDCREIEAEEVGILVQQILEICMPIWSIANVAML
jgi:hypothetical protein